MPMPLAIIVPLTKPECWLTALLWLTSANLVRWRALFFAGSYLLYACVHVVAKPYFAPFTKEQLLAEVRQAGEEDTHQKMSKILVYGETKAPIEATPRGMV